MRKINRNALLVAAARQTADTARREFEGRGAVLADARVGLAPWLIGDVARTSLAWGEYKKRTWHPDTLQALCSVNHQLMNEGLRADIADGVGTGRTLRRMFFEQFRHQRSERQETARAMLLFGPGVEYPEGRKPSVMTTGWFERLMGGWTLEEYIETVIMIASLAQNNGGVFAPNLLVGAQRETVDRLLSFELLTYVFENQLLTNVADFRHANAQWQDARPDAVKKFAFNPLVKWPFVTGVAASPIAPWAQVIDQRAYPPAIYHLAMDQHKTAFSGDFGYVFEHYIGRQLRLIEGAVVMPEVRYGPANSSDDSCDWFLDLPGVLVVIECKARQPDEALRVSGFDEDALVARTVNKAICQLNRSNANIANISHSLPKLDVTKPRVGLIVTLEPFYFNQDIRARDGMLDADFPVGVASADELESLVLLSAAELSNAFLQARRQSENNIMLLTDAVKLASGRENPLLSHAWESMPIFDRIDVARERVADSF